MSSVLAVRKATVAHPTGDPKFSVLQAFPGGFSAEEADPFLMCDEFGPSPSPGKSADPDSFPVDWHGHYGMDIVTYLREGVGRHADSLGNSLTYNTPGVQWMSVGSGVEHAEGGGTPEGENEHGFQIWINVPAARRSEQPRYGTYGPSELQTVAVNGDNGENAMARVLAGTLGDTVGPIATTVNGVFIADMEVPPGNAVDVPLPDPADNALVYVYFGSGKVCGASVPTSHVARLAPSGAARLEAAGDAGMRALVFAGRRLNEPLVWHGPFVASSKDELSDVLNRVKCGQFPPKRVSWNYRKSGNRPKNPMMLRHQDSLGGFDSPRSDELLRFSLGVRRARATDE